MKFFLTLAFVATAALAQQHQIGYPPNGTTAALGSTITVEVDRPVSLQGSVEAGMVIAIQSCPTDPCVPPSQQVGFIVYNGPYDPEYHNTPEGPYKPPHQNFSIVIPPAGEFGGPVAPGRAQLSAIRFNLIGAGPSPLLSYASILLNIV